jgi:hypothetical protein
MMIPIPSINNAHHFITKVFQTLGIEIFQKTELRDFSEAKRPFGKSAFGKLSDKGD